MKVRTKSETTLLCLDATAKTNQDRIKTAICHDTWYRADLKSDCHSRINSSINSRWSNPPSLDHESL